MKQLENMQELNMMKKQDVIDWCKSLTDEEKWKLQNWIGETGKEDFMSIKHYLGHKFYPHFYKEKEPTFQELLAEALTSSY